MNRDSVGGRVIDYAGAPLDGGKDLDRGDLRPLFSSPPLQAEIKPIDQSLHTGTLAIDALTPIGRGQTMLLLGQRGTGKTSLAWDAVLSQATSA